MAAAASAGDESTALRIFLSARFGPGGAQKEVYWMHDQLAARQVIVYPSREPGNLDRAKDIAEGIKACDIFAFFGQAHYGEDTGNPMCSYEEFKYAKKMQKPIAWINMNGGEQPDNPVIQMGLQGCIYEMWHQDDAVVIWLLDKALTASRARTSSGAAEEEETMDRGRGGAEDELEWMRGQVKLEREARAGKTHCRGCDHEFCGSENPTRHSLIASNGNEGSNMDSVVTSMSSYFAGLNHIHKKGVWTGEKGANFGKTCPGKISVVRGRRRKCGHKYCGGGVTGDCGGVYGGKTACCKCYDFVSPSNNGLFFDGG